VLLDDGILIEKYMEEYKVRFCCCCSSPLCMHEPTLQLAALLFDGQTHALPA
jgi:hypothetical protein